MLARRLRSRPNINPALGQCLVFAGEESTINEITQLPDGIATDVNPSPVLTVYTRVEASFKPNEMPLKLIK